MKEEVKESEDWEDEPGISLSDFLALVGMTEQNDEWLKFKDGFVKKPQQKLVRKYKVDFIPFI